MPLTRLLRLIPLIAVAVALALLTSPLTSHAAPAGQLLLVTSDVTYDIRPDAGPVHVSWDVRVDNQDPETVEREFGTVFFYDSLPVPVLRGSANLQARSGPTVLPVSVDPSGDGPLSTALVSFDRELFYGETFSFSLEYDLPSARDDSLLVTRYYVFLPAVSIGDQSSVSITTPSDQAWEATIEPVDCTGPGPDFVCPASSPEQIHLAAFAEVSRPDAAVTSTLSQPLAGIDVTLTYFQGEEAWAQHLEDLVTAALPLLEELYGFPLPGPLVVNIAERGRQIILGYEGLTSCDSTSCDIAISPIASDLTALHEMAHLWSDVYNKRWLSEGFAELIAGIAAQRLGPGLVRGPTDPPPETTLDLRLDDWGDITYLIDATPDELAGEEAGYDHSYRFLRLLEDTIGLDALQRANADMAQEGVPADSGRFLDALEIASGRDLSGPFLQWVFPASTASVLEQRRQALDRLAALTIVIREEGLDPSPFDAIQADVTNWRFDDALSALDTAEADIQIYINLKEQLASLRETVQTTGLSFPPSIEEAIAAWRFGDLGQTIEDAEDALAAYSRAREKVDQPRNPWQRLGLWGSDPEDSLDKAAVSFAAGDFTETIAHSADAYDRIDGAGATALVRMLIVIAVVAAAVTAIATVIWLRRRHSGFA